MAPKKATATMSASDDSEILQDAYGDSLKKQLQIFFDAYLDNHQEAENRFVAGLSKLREARDRARELI